MGSREKGFVIRFITFSGEHFLCIFFCIKHVKASLDMIDIDKSHTLFEIWVAFNL